MEGRIFNLDFDKGFEILDVTMEGGYSILSRIKNAITKYGNKQVALNP
jgi:hypothetical protein